MLYIYLNQYLFIKMSKKQSILRIARKKHGSAVDFLKKFEKGTGMKLYQSNLGQMELRKVKVPKKYQEPLADFLKLNGEERTTFLRQANRALKQPALKAAHKTPSVRKSARTRRSSVQLIADAARAYRDASFVMEKARKRLDALLKK